MRYLRTSIHSLVFTSVCWVVSRVGVGVLTMLTIIAMIVISVFVERGGRRPSSLMVVGVRTLTANRKKSATVYYKANSIIYPGSKSGMLCC